MAGGGRGSSRPSQENLLAVGTPEDVAQVKESHTGRYLHQVLTRSRQHRVGQRLGERSSPAA